MQPPTPPDIPQNLLQKYNLPKHPYEFPYTYEQMFVVRGYRSSSSFIFWRFLRGMKLGMRIYAPIHLLPILIFKRDKLKKQPMATLSKFVVDVLKSCAFISTLQCLFAWILIMSNRLFGVDHPLAVYCSGFMAGGSVLFEKKNRRLELGLYCVPRVIEIIDRYLKSREIWSGKHERLLWTCMFAFSSGLLMLFYHTRRSMMKPSIRSLLRLLIAE